MQRIIEKGRGLKRTKFSQWALRVMMVRATVCATTPANIPIQSPYNIQTSCTAFRCWLYLRSKWESHLHSLFFRHLLHSVSQTSCNIVTMEFPRKFPNNSSTSFVKVTNLSVSAKPNEHDKNMIEQSLILLRVRVGGWQMMYMIELWIGSELWY